MSTGSIVRMCRAYMFKPALCPEEDDMAALVWERQGPRRGLIEATSQKLQKAAGETAGPASVRGAVEVVLFCN